MQTKLLQLRSALAGELHFDHLLRALYATDASVYRELPLAVAYPKDKEDIKKLIAFARENGTSLIPRSAGTSLAGQCVGSGIVVDISKHWNKILEINIEERWVRVQPGVIRDELNEFLKNYGLFFGPNTSTANRCMIGGMVGNNSCGTTSIVYGSTRDHLLEVEAILSDGSEVIFGELNETAFFEKINSTGATPAPAGLLERKVYRHIHGALADAGTQQNIRREFPKPAIHRRNTGYAVDLLLNMKPFQPDGPDFNFCKLLAGSEGTLAFTTAVKLNVVLLPLPVPVVLAAHFTSLDECMNAVLVAMRHRPDQCELMDKAILDCTKGNIEQMKNRFFVEGDPAAVLMVEFRADTLEATTARAEALKLDFRSAGMGYAFPFISGKKTQQVWTLRNAGLGVLSNIPGDAKPVAFIEDTAVALADLPAYIKEFGEMMRGFGQQAVYYAHAGAGELHLRPILNLKKKEGVQLFHDIGLASAKLVKKYGGSLSGEHGDGRVRASFIPLMLGEANYELLRSIKKTWDPHGIFNPGKIVDAPPMTESLRYQPEKPTPEYETVFDFSDTGGILRAAEKCNGSGDCRRLDFSGGTMCPSYRATRDEKDTTRARANALREFLSNPPGAQRLPSAANNPFAAPELKEVMDLCLSCKGCTSECPSNVDMATMKAEFQHQYYKTHGVPFRAKFFGHIGRMNAVLSYFPFLPNLLTNNPVTGGLLKKIVGVAPQRSLPPLHRFTLRSWYKKHRNGLSVKSPPKGKVFLFCDEFTNFYDVEIGIKAIRLLTALGYEVEMPRHPQSGRAQLSKGLLPEAQKLARENVRLFSKLVSDKTPLIGIEPSAILGFRDEYPRLVAKEEMAIAKSLAANALLIDEFLAKEIQQGNITPEHFTKAPKKVLLHGHCHQKALAGVEASAWVTGLPANYEVEVIPSGCCGMAGSFGYEAEHFGVSMKIGELVLFPAVRKAGEETIIAAPGTSCRHQILDGTGRRAGHPLEVLWGAMGQ
ncbi:MAG: FAD-linked oxidase C-terminal domain-containing protein [Saprospiraceae bacterium]